MKVKITSPCMAMLVYEASKSNGQVEGYLCGDTTKETTRQITDSNVTTTTEDILSIHYIKPPCKDILGTVTKDASTNGNTTKIVGRFKFCRRPVLSLTVREKSNHRKLVRCTGNGDRTVTILMQEAWVEMQSTYAWRCVAFIEQTGRFVPIPVEIVNLKATTCGTYKPYPSIHQEERLPQVNKALSTLEATCTGTTNNSMNVLHMVEATRKMSSDITKSLDNSVTILRVTEAALEKAYAEKIRLKRRILELQSRNSSVKPEQSEEPKDAFHDEATDSSDSEGSYGCDKANELLQEFQETPSAKCNSVATTEFDDKPESKNSLATVQTPVAANTKKSPEDLFVGLVDIAKADLVKKDFPGQDLVVNLDSPCSSTKRPKDEGT